MTAKTSLMKQTWATPGSGGNVGQVRDPQPVGRTGGEVAAKQIRVVWRLRGAHNVARPQARRLECGARAGSAARARSGYPWCSPRPGPYHHLEAQRQGWAPRPFQTHVHGRCAIACGSPTFPASGRSASCVRTKVGFVCTAFVTNAFPARSRADRRARPRRPKALPLEA